MNDELIQRLVNIMTANDLNTLDVRDGTKRIVLRRGAPAPVMMSGAPIAMPHAAPHAPAAPPSAKPSAGGDEEAGMLAIRSPMVGTFYSKPNPESKAFVTIG